MRVLPVDAGAAVLDVLVITEPLLSVWTGAAVAELGSVPNVTVVSDPDIDSSSAPVVVLAFSADQDARLLASAAAADDEAIMSLNLELRSLIREANSSLMAGGGGWNLGTRWWAMVSRRGTRIVLCGGWSVVRSAVSARLRR